MMDKPWTLEQDLDAVATEISPLSSELGLKRKQGFVLRLRGDGDSTLEDIE
jgi:hypothetical protein